MIIFISCGKSKQDQPSQAAELYTGSLFKKCKKWAEKHGEYYILSAKHGVLPPHAFIGPYDCTLKTASQKKAWQSMVLRQLADKGFDANDTVTSLAPRAYTQALKSYFKDVREPLLGKRMGERMALL